MRNIEEGTDLNGNTVWFVLEGAELIGVYTSEIEAQANL
jgi:hypothetical protein